MILMRFEQFLGCFLLWAEGDLNCIWEMEEAFCQGQRKKTTSNGRISFTGFGAREDLWFQPFAKRSPFPSRFSIMSFNSHQSTNSKLQIGLTQCLPETCHDSGMALRIYLLNSLPSSLLTYYTNVIELILQRLG